MCRIETLTPNPTTVHSQAHSTVSPQGEGNKVGGSQTHPYKKMAAGRTAVRPYRIDN